MLIIISNKDLITKKNKAFPNTRKNQPGHFNSYLIKRKNNDTF